MLITFMKQTVPYYGRQVGVCQLCNVIYVDSGLTVRLFDPTSEEAFLQLGARLGWDVTREGRALVYKTR